MKILAEEIVKRHPADDPDKGPGNRYRRSQIGLLDCPESLLSTIQDGCVLTLDNGGVDNNTRRKLVVAAIRVAVLEDVDHIGLIIDLISVELYKAIKEDEDAPANYAEFCKLEGIEP